MGRLALVGFGGFLGTVLRYLLAGWVHRLLPGALFPWGTLVVNVAGCFLIGSLQGLGEVRGIFGPTMRLFLLIGLLGGFTTYSTFAFETVALGHGGEAGAALLNVAAHVVAGIGAAWLGLALTRGM